MKGPEDAVIVRWHPPGGPAQRLFFEPRVDGFYRKLETWTGSRWRTDKTEIVDRVAVENVPASAVD